MNNRVKIFFEECVEKNSKGVIVVNCDGLIKLEEIYKKIILEEELIDEEVLRWEFLEIFVDEKNIEIICLYE